MKEDEAVELVQKVISSQYTVVGKRIQMRFGSRQLLHIHSLELGLVYFKHQYGGIPIFRTSFYRMPGT